MRSSATDRKPESMFQQKTGSSWKTRRWAVILTLGVVIMFVSTSLSVVETLFFNRLPVANERSLAIIENNPSYLLPDGFPSRRYLPYAAFEYLGPDFMGMDIAAMSAYEATIMDRGFPERIGIELVSTNFFRVLGVGTHVHRQRSIRAVGVRRTGLRYQRNTLATPIQPGPRYSWSSDIS